MQISRKKPHKGAAKQYFFGVFLSLQSLYAILLIIKSFGHTVGWGFQLQSPLMIQSLIVLFNIISCIIKFNHYSSTFIRNYQLKYDFKWHINDNHCNTLHSALLGAIYRLPYSIILIGIYLNRNWTCIANDDHYCISKKPRIFTKIRPIATIINGLFSIGFGVTIGWLTCILNAQQINIWPFFMGVLY